MLPGRKNVNVSLLYGKLLFLMLHTGGPAAVTVCSSSFSSSSYSPFIRSLNNWPQEAGDRVYVSEIIIKVNSSNPRAAVRSENIDFCLLLSTYAENGDCSWKHKNEQPCGECVSLLVRHTWRCRGSQWLWWEKWGKRCGRWCSLSSPARRTCPEGKRKERGSNTSQMWCLYCCWYWNKVK